MNEHRGVEEMTEGAPTLRDAEDAFERGDYGLVRAVCRKLIDADGPDSDVGSRGSDAEKAAELLRRVSFDPVQAVVLAGCLVVFAVIVYLYVLR